LITELTATVAGANQAVQRPGGETPVTKEVSMESDMYANQKDGREVINSVIVRINEEGI